MVELGLAEDMALAHVVALAPAVALVEVAAADPLVALGGVALAQSVAVAPPSALDRDKAPLPVVMFVGRVDGVAAAAVAWCCESWTQSAPGSTTPSLSPF